MEATRITTNRILQRSDLASLAASSSPPSEAFIILPSLLLKWADACACLSAEAHAKNSCVTLSLDDVIFERKVHAQPGDVVELKAQVNRAFNTSMEVGLVGFVISDFGRKRAKLFSSYFVFVSIDKDGKKCKTPSLKPVDAKDVVRFHLAGERRKIRFRRKEIASRVRTASKSMDVSSASGQGKSTSLITCHLVLPPDANHHSTTFGGTIVAWAIEQGKTVASRHALAHVVLASVDDIFFRGPSHVGDRVTVKARVNRVFSRSMEVGVRIEANGVSDRESRHILTAFFTFVGDCVLPRVLVSEGDEKAAARHRDALGRRRLRLERMVVRSRSKNENKISWPFSELTDPSTICLQNIKQLMAAAGEKESSPWELLDEQSNVVSWKRFDDNIVSLKTVARFRGVLPDTVFDAVLLSRKKWDPLILDTKIVRKLDESNSIVWLAIRNPQDDSDDAAEHPDFSLLQSWRRNEETGQCVIASHSIHTDLIPAKEGYSRGEVASSGFIIANDGEGGSEVTYVGRLSKSSMKILVSELVGHSRLANARLEALARYVCSCALERPQKKKEKCVIQ